MSPVLSQAGRPLPADREWEENIVQAFSRFTGGVPELSGRWAVEQADYPGVDQYTMVAVPQGGGQCLVVCLQSNDEEGAGQRYTRVGVGRASVSSEPGMPPIPYTLEPWNPNPEPSSPQHSILYPL